MINTNQGKVFIRSLLKWQLHIFLPISLLYGLLMGVSPKLLPIFAIAGALFCLFAYRIFRGEPALHKPRAVLVCVGTAFLFTFMFPASWLVNRNQLKPLYEKFTTTQWLYWIGNLLDNVLVVGLTLLFAFFLVIYLWKITEGMPLSTLEKSSVRGIDILMFAAPILLVGIVFLVAYWPGLLTDDSFAQWLMIDFMLPLIDWHPVGHTLLEYLITRVWYSPAAVALFQIISVGVVWGWAMRHFVSLGVSRKWLFVLSCIFAILPFNGILLVTLWKDVLFSVSCFAIVVLLGLIWLSNGAWLSTWKNLVVFGAALATTTLLRHNGIVIMGFTILMLLLLYHSKYEAILFSAGLAILLTLLVRDGIAFGLLKAERNSPAFMYVIPIHHINSILYHGGEYTTQQKQLLEKLAPIDLWVTQHNEYYADLFTKPNGIMQDPDVLDKITLYRNEFFSTFIDLFLKYPERVIRSELRLMSLVWEITEPENFRPNTFDFVLKSLNVPAFMDASTFYQPNLNTSLTQMLDRYVTTSWNQSLFYVLFWRGGISLFLTLSLGAMLWLKTGRKSLILVTPTIGLTLSLFFSMPVQNFRYVYPTVISTALIFLFAWVAKTRKSGVPDTRRHSGDKSELTPFLD